MIIPQIDGFEITTWIRETSTAVLWRATQLSLDRPVILQVLKSDAEPTARAAFEANARLVAKIGLPGLVGVYDVSKTAEGQPFVILDSFDGQSLRDTLAANGPFSQKRVLPIARSIAETLSVAWKDHRYVHRNLKPDEIFLLRDGSVRITDFVSATTVGADGIVADRSGDIVGTPSFMPPEQAEARATLDTHADMYALGAILYLLVTGHTPFEEYASDPMRLLQILPFGTLNSPRDFSPSVTPGFEAVLARLLMKNPQDRYGSWGGFLQDLDSISAGKAPSIANAFVASGKSTITPSVRHPGVNTLRSTESAGSPLPSDQPVLESLRKGSKTPALAPILWLVLLAALAAFGYWRWNHPATTLSEVTASLRPAPQETKAPPEEEVIPLAPLEQPSAPSHEAMVSSQMPSQEEPLETPPTSSQVVDTPVAPTEVSEATPEPVETSIAITASPSETPAEPPSAVEQDAAFLRSFVGAVRTCNETNLLTVLKRWNTSHHEEATAAAKTLLACGWPNDRLGSRLMNLYGKPISFQYHQQEVTVTPETYVDGRLTGRFHQKDGSTRTVTFPLSDLDARTRFFLYRKGAPAGISTELESHAATALYALAAGDVASFRAEISLSGGFSPIFWRISDALSAREKAASARTTAEP